MIFARRTGSGAVGAAVLLGGAAVLVVEQAGPAQRVGHRAACRGGRRGPAALLASPATAVMGLTGRAGPGVALAALAATAALARTRTAPAVTALLTPAVTALRAPTFAGSTALA
jgi:hypothetical protein